MCAVHLAERGFEDGPLACFSLPGIPMWPWLLTHEIVLAVSCRNQTSLYLLVVQPALTSMHIDIAIQRRANGNLLPRTYHNKIRIKYQHNTFRYLVPTYITKFIIISTVFIVRLPVEWLRISSRIKDAL